MPAKPSYAHRLKAAIETLQDSSASLLGRHDLEELLGVSKTVAWRILRHCQAQKGPGELAPAIVSTRFQNLPANITFTPRSLRMEFYGTEDFLAAVGAIVYALQKRLPRH